MTYNPFINKKPKSEDLAYDEWGGQFSCQEYGCEGYAFVARYFKSVRLLSWECQHGHISKIEGIDE
jgi:hypothetical protein